MDPCQWRGSVAGRDRSRALDSERHRACFSVDSPYLIVQLRFSAAARRLMSDVLSGAER
jgi:hypothetical protein